MKRPEHFRISNHKHRFNSKQSLQWFMTMSAVWSLLTALADSPAKGAPLREREMSVGIEGTVERILNKPDYTPLPVNENASIILRVHSVHRTPEGQYKYNFAYIGLQSGVYNLADYLQNAEGKRVRDKLPAISVTVRALLPEDASTTLPDMPTALPPLRIPYRPTLAALILAWLGCGAALFYRPRPKLMAPPPPPPPVTSLGAILEPLALKAARKTITTEEKVLLEQTIIRFWSEKLEISDLDTAEKREAIMEDKEGGALLRSVERWLYQPYSHILTSEVSKVLAPYFDIPALIESPDNDESNPEESHPANADDDAHADAGNEGNEGRDDSEDHEPDAKTDVYEDESDEVAQVKQKQPDQSDSAASSTAGFKRGGHAQTKKQT